MSIAKKAVKEAEEVTKLAVESAKRDIIERLTPEIKKIVEQGLRGGSTESIDRIRRMQDGHGETEFEEGKKMDNEDDLDLESIGGMFPSIAEEEEVAEAKDEEDMAEAFGNDAALDESDDNDADDMDEEIEISEQELAEFFREGLKLEAQVSKGFKDMTPSGEEIDPKGGLADVKTGEHTWENEEPPAAQDWTVKESVKDLIKKGLAENQALRARVKKYESVISKLQGRLSESNLFNAKVVCVNKFLNKHKLTTEQKKTVIKCIDEAQSIQEAKRIYVVLESSLKAAGALTEGRTKKTGSVTRRGGADPKVLRESAGGGESVNEGNRRLKELAGLIKG